jgi:hypothetical protein
MDKMRNSDIKPKPVLGFLTVVEHPQHGLFGGYLVLNMAGRPLEFHCTAPVKPNRAQEILYGPTLNAFLYGEQIGHTLIRQSKAIPLLICTNQAAVLAVREHIESPVVLVLPPGADTSVDEAQAAVEGADVSCRVLRIDSTHSRPRLATFRMGRNQLALPERADDDRRIVGERLVELDDTFDLTEPFDRIRCAIEEAQQAVR